MKMKQHTSGCEPGHREHRHHHHHSGGCGSSATGLLEAAIMAPLAIAGCILQTVKKCLTPAGCGTWCDSCNTCGCNCRCEHKHQHEHRHECSTSDIKIETHLGEVRQKVILVENNSPHPVTITLEADPWLNAVATANQASIVFNPPSVTLAHCETAQVTATISVNQPLEAGKVYFSRIHLRGCGRRPISVELCVASEKFVDYYAECETCRPRCGKFVEFCHESSCDEGCSCSKCRSRGWDPFGWLNLFDPHCHWFDECRCERFMLPNLLGMGRC